MSHLLNSLVRFFAVALIMFFAALIFGQDTLPVPTAENPFLPGTNSGLVFTWYAALYGSVTTALTYLQSAFFPKAGSVPKVAVRYILIAGVTAVLFITLGLTDGFGVFIGFVGSALTYDKVLAPLGLKTPKPKQQE